MKADILRIYMPTNIGYLLEIHMLADAVPNILA